MAQSTFVLNIAWLFFESHLHMLPSMQEQLMGKSCTQDLPALSVCLESKQTVQQLKQIHVD